MDARLRCEMPLPPSFRPEDILAFHRRDPQEIAERVTDRSLQKGLVWADAPAGLALSFRRGVVRAELAVDGPAGADDEGVFEALVRRMLGLGQDVEGFERRYRRHPELCRLIAGHPGLRVPVTATPFEALSWAVTGQQISVGAAVSLRRKLILASGLRHSSGLWCYPEARQISRLSEEVLRQASFSQSKARTVLCLAQLVADRRLPLDQWLATPPGEALPVDAIRDALLAVRGVGPWTVNYALLRGFGWLDGSLHGDVAVRRQLQALLGATEKVGERQAAEWLAQFSPWRALVAAHLWVMR